MGNTKKPKHRIADMSLEPSERGRKKKGRTRRTKKKVPAQMNHGNGSKSRHHGRQMNKRFYKTAEI